MPPLRKGNENEEGENNAKSEYDNNETNGECKIDEVVTLNIEHSSLNIVLYSSLPWT